MRIRTGPVIEDNEIGPIPPNISVSQVSKLHPLYQYSCPRQWGYQYRLKLPFISSMPLVMGSAFDAGLNHWYRMQILMQRAVAAGRGFQNITVSDAVEVATITLDQLISSSRFEKVPTKEQVDVAAIKVGEGIEATIAHELHHAPAAVQVRHEYVLPRIDADPGKDGLFDDDDLIPVVGFSDLIDMTGVIVDHKWSGRARWGKLGGSDDDEVPTGDSANWCNNDENTAWYSEKYDQLLSYWISRMAEERRGVLQPAPVTNKARIVVCYHNTRLKSPQVHSVEIEFSHADIWRWIQRVREADVIKRGNLPARPGKPCGFCSFVDRCRADEWERGTPFPNLIAIPTTTG